MMNKAIAKYRKEGCLGEWFLTDFTMEQVEGRIENLEEEVKRLREENAALRKDKDRLEKQVELTAYLQANIPFELKAYVQCPACGESYSSEELIVKNIDGECLDHEEVEQKKGGHN